MSLLVGVRGQSRDNESPGMREGGLREGITQQPSPFYNNNPSSIIWGNKPTPPHWRDDNGSSFNNAAAFSGFGILQQQQQEAHKEEKEKDGPGAGMVGGEGRASLNSRGRRHLTRVHSGRNNSNSNSWGFGFSSQFQPGSAHSSPSSSVPGSGLPRSSVFTFGATDSDATTIPDTTGPARQISIPQDDRMEDISEVIPVFANLTVNDHSGDLKFVNKSDEQVRVSAGVAGHEDNASPSSWVLGSDVSRKFSGLGLGQSSVPATGEEDAPAVFVFGAKLSGNDTAAVRPKSNPTPDVTPSPRPRPLKVKRSVSSIKGKAIATGNNGASFGGTPSQQGLHEKGSHSQSSSVSGECSFSQPPVFGMGSSSYGPTAAVPVGPANPFTRDGDGDGNGDSAPPQAFTSSSPVFSTSSSAQENSASGLGERHDSCHESEATSPAFFNFDIASGSDRAKEPTTESDVSTAAGDLLRASLDETDVSQQSSFNLFNREEPSTISSASRNECTDEGRSSGGSLNISLDDFSDNANKNAPGEHDFPSSSPLFAGGHADSVQDLSSDLALKLGLGSAGTVPGQDIRADSNAAGEFHFPSCSTQGGAVRPQDEALTTRNVPPKEERKAAVAEEGRNQGEERFQPQSSSLQTGDFLKGVKDATDDVQRPSSQFFNRPNSGADGIPANPHPFVFGASRSKFSSTKPGSASAAAEAAPFRFSATSTPLSPSVSFDFGGASSGTVPPAPHLPSFKHKSPRYAGNDGGAAILSSREESEAVPFSLSSFNLGAGRPSVKANANDDGLLRETQDVSPPSKEPAPAPAPSFIPANSDSDGTSSYFSAPSRFVFSAGTSTASAASSSQATPDRTGGQEETGWSNEKDSAAATSNFFEAHSSSQQQSGDDSVSSRAFEFRASSVGGSVSGSGGKGPFGRKKSLRTPGSRRQSRYSATSKEKRNSSPFAGFADVSGNVDEAGSPMDFSPQRYTPPDETIHDLQKASKQQPAWASSMYTDWSQYSETDVAMENLRNAANDLAFGSQPAGRSPWQRFGQEKGQGESWLGGKENVPRRTTTAGKNGKWKRAVLDESQSQVQGQDQFADKDKIWKGVSLGSAKEPKSAASSSTPSVDSSGSSGGWGQFTFTAGSSPNFSSTTSFLRRHARRIQRERSGPGSFEPSKSEGGLKSQGESLSPLLRAGVKSGPGVGGATASAASAAAGAATSTTNHPLFPFDPSLNASGSLPRPDDVKPVSPKAVGAAATEQVCERWRLRGNQAYANGDFPKAEEYYSRGASSVPPNETSQSCIRASMLCYSNRAATRMVVGRMREALADCMRAMAVDPNFLRVRLRAASCHLALGETASAVRAFKECLQRAKEEDQPDMKISSEAAEGLRKSTQVDEYLDRAQEILANGSSGDTPAALRLLNEALLSSPHSERAIELKSRALLVLRRYEEVVQLCEQSLLTAERNHPLPNGDAAIHQLLQAGGSDTATKYTGSTSPLKMWRWQLSAKAKFYLGRLEEALEDLRKYEIACKDAPQKTNPTGPSPHADGAALSIGTISDLLRHKAAGNEAFQCGKHTEAVEHYSAALACNGDSRPFNAVCFCNRAAASQALGNIGDAISDCSRAIVLDPKYAKAISRRATLHEKVRDYGQSCHDLQRLITLLESQQQQARVTLNPGWVGRPATNSQQDLSQARDRLAKVEDEVKKGHPLDHYMILGLEPGCSSIEVKKAYRKAALRHHPDKAGQFLGRSEGGDDGGMWKEVADEVRSDAERLFKLIGEANAILSDSQKRTRYDAEEEFRKLRTRTSAATSGLSEMYRNTAERGQAGGGGGRRTRDRWGDHGRDAWSGYSHQQQRWQSGPDAAQPDTYARRGRYGSNNSSRNGEGDRWNDYDWDDV